MKRINFILFLILYVVLPLKVNALNVSKNILTIDKGNNEYIELSTETEEEISEINFSLVYTSYDIPAYFNIESGLTEEVNGIKHKITFTEPVTGKIKLGKIRINAVNNPKTNSGTINIHTASAITTSGEKINLHTQTINVTINTKTPEKIEETPKDNTNMLSKIESQIVNIELQEDVFEYTVNIKEEIQELDLKPIAKDEKYEIEISNQKISELTDNQITIKVKNDKNTEEYKITVKVAEKVKDEQIELDESEFKSTYKYKGKWTVLIIIFGFILFSGLYLISKNK